MRVTVRLYASLAKYEPRGNRGAPIPVDLPDGATVADLLAHLGIPREHARMIVSDDEQIADTAVLRDGQHVALYPPIAGGSG